MKTPADKIRAYLEVMKNSARPDVLQLTRIVEHLLEALEREMEIEPKGSMKQIDLLEAVESAAKEVP